MVKTHTTLSINAQVLEEAKLIISNISGEFEEFLRLRVSTSKGDSTTASLILLEKELEKEIKTLDKLNISIRMKKDKIELIKKDVEAKEVNRIKNEKLMAEKVMKCVLCGVTIEGQKKELAYEDDEGRKFYHHVSCFMDKLEQHKWNKKEEYLAWLHDNTKQ